MSTGVRVIICGSRRWTDRDVITNRLHDLVLSYPPHTPITIVHGDARGADRISVQEALKHGLRVEAHPAEWDTYGKAAGPLRNTKMASLGADLCIAFLKDGSRGTMHMIEAAHNCGIPVEVIEP